jgi:hypothetical protein
MSNNLQLNIFLKRNNHSCLVFKRNGILYRIDHLIEPLAFVANMVQLNKAIETEAEQDCYLELYNDKKKHWILECRYLNRIVALNLWLDSGSPNGYLDVRFCWDGKPDVFSTAVQHMSFMAECARIFGGYTKKR